MWRLPQQAFALTQRFPHQANFAMFQITQTAVNNPRGPAGGAGRKIILLHQKCSLAPVRALPRNGDSIDSAANHQNVKFLVMHLEWATHFHIYLDAFSRQSTTLLQSII